MQRISESELNSIRNRANYCNCDIYRTCANCDRRKMIAYIEELHKELDKYESGN